MNNFYGSSNGSGNANGFAAPYYAPDDDFACIQQDPAQSYAGFGIGHNFAMQQQGPHYYYWAVNQQAPPHHLAGAQWVPNHQPTVAPPVSLDNYMGAELGPPVPAVNYPELPWGGDEEIVGFQHAQNDEPAASSQQPQDKQQPHEDQQWPDLGETLSAQLDREFGGPYQPDVRPEPTRLLEIPVADTPALVPAPAAKKGRKRRTDKAEGVGGKTSKAAPAQPRAATGERRRGRPLGSKDTKKRKPRGYNQWTPAERADYEAREEKKQPGEVVRGKENKGTASAQPQTAEAPIQTEPAPTQAAPASTQTAPIASSPSDNVLIPPEELYGTLDATNNTYTMAEPDSFFGPETDGFINPYLGQQSDYPHITDPRWIMSSPIDSLNGWG